MSFDVWSFSAASGSYPSTLQLYSGFCVNQAYFGATPRLLSATGL